MRVIYVLLLVNFKIQAEMKKTEKRRGIHVYRHYSVYGVCMCSAYSFFYWRRFRHMGL